MPLESNPDELVEAMITARLLDATNGPNRLLIHDWAEHCTHFTHNKIARHNTYFATGEAPNLRRLDPRYRPAAESFYGVSAQSGEKSAQSGEKSAQSGEKSAQSQNTGKQTNVVGSAQSGKKSAQSPLQRARPTPTPTPTPTPSAAATLPVEVILPPTSQQQACTVDSAVVAAALREYGSITKTSVRRFITACLNGTGYSESQILAGIVQVGSTIGKRADNPIGILISQVPDALPGIVAGQEIQSRRPRKGSAGERDWVMAEQALQNSESTKEEIEWAKKIIGKSE